jgi:hypothetical protein
MQFITLALGVLSLAGLVVGEANNSKALSSYSVSHRPGRSHPGMTDPSLARSHPTNSIPTWTRKHSSGSWGSTHTAPVLNSSSAHSVKPTHSSIYGTSSERSFTRTHPTETVSTKSIHTTPAQRREEISISLTLPADRPCSSGSSSHCEQQQTDVCGPTDPFTGYPDKRECATSWYAYWACAPTMTFSTNNDFGGPRSPRWVANFARATPAEAVSTITIIPTASHAVDRREEPIVTSSHFIYTPSCGWGYKSVSTTREYMSYSSFRSDIDGGRSCTVTATWPGPGCTQTLCPSGFKPVQPSAPTDSVTRYSIKVVTPTRNPQWVAQFAARLSQDLGGRSQRAVAQFAARSTQDLSSRTQRYVARFASHTVTTKPNAADVTPPPFPICSFDLSKGQYICPEATPTLPICSFDLSKGQYICPDVSKPTASPAPCPGGAKKCIPMGEEGILHAMKEAETTMETVKKA